MVSEIMLRHAAPVALGDVTFVAIHVHAPTGLPLTVSLGVDADEETDYELGIGDTFLVRGEVWVLDRVENHLSRDYRVFLRKAQ
ncbi:MULTISPECIES: DUF6406 domain-containing protein [unclassified Streptomyces]|uniref:DUF6406 domain-containing protein n=1 Tax=unclassified Streptomyces TaxID=2593676 RepID=UPI00226D9CF5|nr:MULTISPECIES: DUF6406 domain-containing protein [unclassified Streptomyces]MCY0919520.1 hypothetical protein [Streptomyces sp. H27-G5]MCY0959830.1 hypothetical protein [Streptomyces sp. H27-H5]